MELLVDYSSSSSSSLSTATTQPRPSPTLPTNRNHDALFARGAPDALPVAAAHDPDRAGHRGHRAPRTAGADDRDGRRRDGSDSRCRGATRKRGGVTRATLRKRRRSSVVVTGCDRDQGDRPEFARRHPHWEGRWVGHIHLPLPTLDSLDVLSINKGDEVSPKKNPVQKENDRILNERGKERGCGVHNKLNSGSSSGEDSSSSSSEDEEDSMPHSCLLLSAARTLIRYWAGLLEDEANEETADSEDGGDTPSVIAVVSHVPMHRAEATTNSATSQLPADEVLPSTPLHISLARPICLPAPSVEPFLAEMQKQLTSVLSITRAKNNANHREGRTLHLQPHEATIFTNDQHTRSFLGIPVCRESAQWVKQLLLPPIDDAMVQFGLDTYYSTEDGGCILHVSIASVAGNVIPRILCRRQPGTETRDFASTKSISLFSTRHTHTKDRDALDSLPRDIPVRVNRIQCQFGKAKQVVIPF